jgi:hypothetical protein
MVVVQNKLVNKSCSRCKQTLSATLFRVNKYAPSGFRSICKVCEKKRRRTVERVCQYCKKSFLADRYEVSYGFGTFCSMSCRSKAERPWKREKGLPQVARYARSRTYKRIVRGEVVKPNLCSKCKETGLEIQGHHPDYSEPDLVIWLCRACHHDLHVMLR